MRENEDMLFHGCASSVLGCHEHRFSLAHALQQTHKRAPYSAQAILQAHFDLLVQLHDFLDASDWDGLYPDSLQQFACSRVSVRTQAENQQAHKQRTNKHTEKSQHKRKHKQTQTQTQAHKNTNANTNAHTHTYTHTHTYSFADVVKLMSPERGHGILPLPVAFPTHHQLCSLLLLRLSFLLLFSGAHSAESAKTDKWACCTQDFSFPHKLQAGTKRHKTSKQTHSRAAFLAKTERNFPFSLSLPFSHCGV